MCLRKGYKLSASAILGSVVISFAGSIGMLFVQRISMSKLPFGYAGLSYFSMGTSLLSGILLAAGVIGVVRSLQSRVKN
jgi:hypothetical protein